MPPSPPKIFDSSGKAPEFSFTASHDAQGNRLALDISGSSAAGTGSSNSKAKDDGPPALRDPDAVATLVAEIRSIKDLLGVLVAEKRLAAAPVPPCDYAPPSHEKGSLAATPLYRFYDDADILELARRACPSDEAMAYFRESFISEFTKMNEWSEEGPANRPATHDGPTVFSCKGPADSVLRVHREVVPIPGTKNKWRPRWLERRRAPLTPKSLKSEDAVQLVEADWPVANVAQGVKVDGKICIKWNFRQEDFKISWTVLYLYYEDGGIMECDRFSHILLRNEVNNRLRGAVTKPLEQLSHEVITPGKIWVVKPCHDKAINFEQLSFLSAILHRPLDVDSSLVLGDISDAGNQLTAAIETICSFAGPWKPMHLRKKICLVGTPNKYDEGNLVPKFSFFRRHDIRCFSSRDPYYMGLKYGDGPTESYLKGSRNLPHYYPVPSDVPPKGLATSRQSGIFPSFLKETKKRFTEKRLSVICLVSDYNYTYDAPAFRIIIINDLPELTTLVEDDVKNWRSSGLKIQGVAAWQMAYQATIFGLIPVWEREWASCLDELDNSVRVKMEDIMNEDTKESMMFDASFRRSRFYFEVIQLLRIFSDMIREMRRDLQTMISDPRMAMDNLSGYDRFMEAPSEDSKHAIRSNWELVDAQQKAAEHRLLVRITELSGDMQSLRDGLFNATALLEASRSTAMSRYVFAFTIVTVVFLPPSFIATVFSTQFFNKAEMPDTIALYRNSTIAVAIVTYAASIILIYLTDRFGLIQKAWTAVVSEFEAMMPRKHSPPEELSEKTAKAEHSTV